MKQINRNLLVFFLHVLLTLISVSQDGFPHGECNKDKSRLKIAAAIKYDVVVNLQSRQYNT